jgi:hypothetical protein
MYYTKYAQCNDVLLIRSKNVAPLNIYILYCVDWYYVMINLKYNVIYIV